MHPDNPALRSAEYDILRLFPVRVRLDVPEQLEGEDCPEDRRFLGLSQVPGKTDKFAEEDREEFLLQMESQQSHLKRVEKASSAQRHLWESPNSSEDIVPDSCRDSVERSIPTAFPQDTRSLMTQDS